MMKMKTYFELKVNDYSPRITQKGKLNELNDLIFFDVNFVLVVSFQGE